MPDDFESSAINLMADALSQSLERLRMLGLVNGDADAARSLLAKLIMEATKRGEKSQENLILYAMGRFQADKPNKEP